MSGNKTTGLSLLTAGDILALPHGPADRRFTYGDHPSQFVELRLPKGPGPHPCVALLHGGGWVSHFAGLDYMAPLAEALAEVGIASWNIEYRRADEDGGGFPGTFRDVAAAMDLLGEAGAEHGLDLSRTVVAGHSAGGHLALWAAARGKLPPDAETWTADPFLPALAVCVAGPGDLEAARSQMAGPCEGDQIARLMGGGEADVPARYREGSPIRLLPLGVPQRLIAGQHDHIVPIALMDEYAEAAEAAGDNIELIVQTMTGHHELCHPDGPLVGDFLDLLF